jgi:hypothetical protein
MGRPTLRDRVLEFLADGEPRTQKSICYRCAVSNHTLRLLAKQGKIRVVSRIKPHGVDSGFWRNRNQSNWHPVYQLVRK